MRAAGMPPMRTVKAAQDDRCRAAPRRRHMSRHTRGGHPSDQDGDRHPGGRIGPPTWGIGGMPGSDHGADVHVANASGGLGHGRGTPGDGRHSRAGEDVERTGRHVRVVLRDLGRPRSFPGVAESSGRRLRRHGRSVVAGAERGGAAVGSPARRQRGRCPCGSDPAVGPGRRWRRRCRRRRGSGLGGVLGLGDHAGEHHGPGHPAGGQVGRPAGRPGKPFGRQAPAAPKCRQGGTTRGGPGDRLRPRPRHARRRSSARRGRRPIIPRPQARASPPGRRLAGRDGGHPGASLAQRQAHQTASRFGRAKAR